MARTLPISQTTFLVPQVNITYYLPSITQTLCSSQTNFWGVDLQNVPVQSL